MTASAAPRSKALSVAREILLVEDSVADIRLTEEVLRGLDDQLVLHVARDGVQAMERLHRRGAYGNARLPDLVLLDLNLPRKDGRAVLSEMKADPLLRRIPVCVLSTSDAVADVTACYNLHANCYVQKPMEFDAFSDLMQRLGRFWFGCVLFAPQPVGLANV